MNTQTETLIAQPAYLDLHPNKENLCVRKPVQRALQGRVSKSPRPILMGRLSFQPQGPKKGTLIERIKAKQEMLKTPAPKDFSFVKSQVPKLRRVLLDMASNGKNSMPLEDAMEHLKINLTKLGEEEIEKALQMYAESDPQTCSIVKIGDGSQLRIRV